jgi:hypothetical protein
MITIELFFTIIALLFTLTCGIFVSINESKKSVNFWYKFVLIFLNTTFIILLFSLVLKKLLDYFVFIV